MREIPGCYCLRSHFLDDMSQTSISLCLKFNYIPYIAIYHTYIYHISVKWPIPIKTSPCVPAALQLLQLFVDEIPPGVLPARHGGQSTWAMTHPALVYIYIWNLMGITGWRSTYPSEKYESAGIIIPNIWKNNPNVPNHQPYIYVYIIISYWNPIEWLHHSQPNLWRFHQNLGFNQSLHIYIHIYHHI